LLGELKGFPTSRSRSVHFKILIVYHVFSSAICKIPTIPFF
jgi:hypothetical protein